MAQITIPNSNQEVITEQNIFNNAWFIFFQAVYKAIRASLGLKLSGTLNSSASAQSNTGSGATDLISYTLSGNSMKNDLDCLEIRAWGSYAANANNKRIQLYFGSQVIFDTTALPINGGYWSLTAEITRTSATTQNILVTAFYNNLARITSTAGTQDLSSAVIIKSVATGVSTNDITQKVLTIKLTPYD